MEVLMRTFSKLGLTVFSSILAFNSIADSRHMNILKALPIDHFIIQSSLNTPMQLEFKERSQQLPKPLRGVYCNQTNPTIMTLLTDKTTEHQSIAKYNLHSRCAQIGIGVKIVLHHKKCYFLGIYDLHRKAVTNTNCDIKSKFHLNTKTRTLTLTLTPRSRG
jgi:hypothetical protein